MSFLLPKLASKLEVDKAIKETEDLVLVLRFGRENDTACLQLDDIVSAVVSRCSMNLLQNHSGRVGSKHKKIIIIRETRERERR